MDNKFDEYITKLVEGCMQSPNFTSLAHEQQQSIRDQLTNHFYDLIMDVVLDNLTPEQIEQIKDLSFDNPEMETKIAEFTTQMPNLLSQVDQKLSQEAENIKATGQIPQEPQN